MNKITEVERDVEYITGQELLNDIENYQGQILYCKSVPSKFSGEGEGCYLIVTDTKDQPVVELNTGIIWRNDIEECEFIVVHSAIQIN